MLLPIRDALASRGVPIVTIVLILLNALVYVAGLVPAERQVDGSTRQVSNHDIWLVEYGAIPCELLGRCGNQRAIVEVDGGPADPRPRSVSAQVDAHPPALTLLSSLFLHVGLVHLAWNMLFLWVFGGSLERAMRPLGFLGFYLLAGMGAGVVQALAIPSETAPTVGASGAVAAVLGAYVVLYPRVLVLTIIFIPFVRWVAAWVVIGCWGLLQLVGTWQDVLAPERLDRGVAYVAHVAGFAFGAAVVHFFAERPEPEQHAVGVAVDDAAPSRGSDAGVS